MTSTAATDTPGSPAGVLAGLRTDKADADAAEVRMFIGAVEWAIMHPVESIQLAATVEGTEDELTIAGAGAPLVAEFCIAELALALGKSTTAGRRYLGDAIETRYRLPRLWARVVAGEVTVWRARRIATATITLPAEGADYVDQHLAPLAETCSYARLEAKIEEARARFDPDAAEAKRAEQAEQRHLHIHLGDTTTDGLAHLEGTLDLADALALEAALATKAHDLLATYPDLSLDVRRSMAAGQLGSSSDDGATSREVVIHTHHDTTSAHALVGVENTRSWITLEQLAAWCQAAGTRVTIRPVIDLGAHLHTDSYTPTAAQREQAILTNPTCVYPRCEVSSRTCDLDHITDWACGGPTTSANLAPLCRHHHRLKTHGHWTYHRTGPTTFTWTSPHGQTYERRT